MEYNDIKIRDKITLGWNDHGIQMNLIGQYDGNEIIRAALKPNDN